MIKLKKSELELVLFQIASFDAKDGKMVGGLLTETLTLGTKRALQKIHKTILPLYKEYLADIEEIKKEVGEDKEKLKSENDILSNEEVEISSEPVKWSFLENVSSAANYNFDVIDKIAV